MNILPRKLDELIEDNFGAIDRHYPAIFTVTVLTLVAGAIAGAIALDCNAGEFLGLVAAAISLAAALELAHRAYYDRANGR